MEMYYAEGNAFWDPNNVDPLKILTLNFCIRFMEELPDEIEAEEEGYSGDSLDYAAWGKALTGDWVEDEVRGGTTWLWVRHWERLLGQEKELVGFTKPDQIKDILETEPNY